MTCTLFLCGDVMTGRGVDQILPRPSRPELHEPTVRSSLEYVALAEQAHGAIPRPVDYSYVWGAALEELERHAPAARIVNLETSITTSEHAEPKLINYRMHPANVGVLSAAGIDCATLANNHVLDWGRDGLRDTLDALASAGIRPAGAGLSAAEAEAPALDIGQGDRVLVIAFGCEDSGVPRGWSARVGTPGVNWIAYFSGRTVARVASLVAAAKHDRDIVVASIHWGANWGYDIPHDHRRFAHQLIEQAGVDLVCGHSSHHVKGIEVHRGRAILYGCGDFINDYEGIGGTPAAYREDLAVMYFPTLARRSGELESLHMVPLIIRNFRLQRPSTPDARWLRDTLDRECRVLGSRVVERDGQMTLRWPSAA